ncbi:hypothetical protein MSAN_02454700 [Mycena sanguinolenta]|uniref:Uncharacterized protein n=1 Tax=Mycena sanguinolenta TaxID=230812 RepID=A0A8H7CAL2_9AGAR|nr:hypothetical protein MSAN_02454700 [Mycena sanguinolenta]
MAYPIPDALLMPAPTASLLQILRILQRAFLNPLRALTQLTWRCARRLISRRLAERPPPRPGLFLPRNSKSFLEYCGSHVPPSPDKDVEISSQVDDSLGPAPQECRGPNMSINGPAEPGLTEEIQNPGDIGNFRPSGSPPLLSSIPRIFPTAPELFNRYSRAETIVKEHTKLTIPPGKHSFARKSREGWTAHVHPEDAHLHIDTVFDTATAFIDEIELFYADNEMITSRRANGVDLVLDLVKSEDGTGETLCGYYFVDHFERIVFWDDAFELDRLSHSRDIGGVTSTQHIMIELTVQFWLHCALFPSAIKVTTELIAELRDVLIHRIGDAMTSPTSTVAESVEDLLKMLTLVESMQENAQADFSGCACILSRFMWKFTSQMFYHFYGEPCARLDKTQSVYGHVPRHSLLIKIIAPILLNAPLTHLRMFEEVYADENVSHVQWRRLIERLDQEWQQLTLFATVLLNADIAFLAIPTVDNGDHAPRSVAQIAIYVSVVASLGSVVVGLFLSRLNRDQRDAEDYVDEAAEYLALHHTSYFGFESLAILYSLPFSLLIWGTFAFLLAFLVMCFQDSNPSTRSLVAFTSFIIISGIAWCFAQGKRSTVQDILDFLGRARRSLHGWKRTGARIAVV